MRWRIAAIALLFVTAPSRAQAPPPAAAIQVPYRLTNTQHVLVRAKINGKGPFNFILDTGAPALFVSKKVVEKVGAKPDARDRVTFDRFEVEGGVVFENAWGKAEDLFQLEGVNGLGLAGAELHGVIGYNLLAQYRIEYDFTRPKLAWTRLKFEPADLVGGGGKSAPAGLEMIGGLMKFVGGLMGRTPESPAKPRGFLGAELADGRSGVVVRRVLADGPAAKAGLKAGDEVRRIGEEAVKSDEACAKALAKQPEGAKLIFAITRGGRDEEVTVELGRGM